MRTALLAVTLLCLTGCWKEIQEAAAPAIAPAYLPPGIGRAAGAPFNAPSQSAPAPLASITPPRSPSLR